MRDEIEDEDRAMRAGGGKYELPLEERIERFEEKLGLRVDPEAIALEMHKRWLAARGIPWDDAKVQGDWRETDEEIGGNFMGNPRDPDRRK